LWLICWCGMWTVLLTSRFDNWLDEQYIETVNSVLASLIAALTGGYTVSFFFDFYSINCRVITID
jgi:hypothetical protein